MSDLLVERRDGILRLTINREERRNALNDAVLTGLTMAIQDPGDSRAVLVTSAGERIFCAGADLAIMNNDATGLEQHEARGGVARLLDAMRASPLPIVGRVQGLCLAGGVGVALGCDVLIASDAAAFGLPEVDRGLWPFMVSALLARHVSPKIAMDLMLSGRRMPAAEAQAVGLTSRVVPAADLDREVDELVSALAAKPPVAVRMGKAAYHAAQEMTLGPALAAMQAQLSLLTQTADAAEGVAAFFEKRSPRWTGR